VQNHDAPRSQRGAQPARGGGAINALNGRREVVGVRWVRRMSMRAKKGGPQKSAVA